VDKGLFMELMINFMFLMDISRPITGGHGKVVGSVVMVLLNWYQERHILSVIIRYIIQVILALPGKQYTKDINHSMEF